MSITRRHSSFQEKKLERFFGVNKVEKISFVKDSKPARFFGEDLLNVGYNVGDSLSALPTPSTIDRNLTVKRLSISSIPSIQTICQTPITSPTARLSLDSCLSLPEIKASMATISRTKLEQFFGETLVLNGKGSRIKVERLLGVDPLTINDSVAASRG